MIKSMLLIIFILTCPAQTVTPESLAQAQLDAYNNRDIDAFLIPYADSIKVYSYPNKFLYQGKDEMRKRYAAMFERTPNLYYKLVNRIVQGNTVIDQELVTKNDRLIEAIAVYKISGVKIVEVRFISKN